MNEWLEGQMDTQTERPQGSSSTTDTHDTDLASRRSQLSSAGVRVTESHALGDSSIKHEAQSLDGGDFGRLTCAIWYSVHIGGQHFDGGLLVRVSLQPVLELSPHLVPNTLELLACEPELGQHLVDLLPLRLQAAGHGRHHSRPLGAATLRQQEAHVAGGDQLSDHLVQALGVPAGPRSGIC